MSTDVKSPKKIIQSTPTGPQRRYVSAKGALSARLVSAPLPMETSDTHHRKEMVVSPATCWIKGQQFDRIAYGNEEEDWGANSRPCAVCGVTKGQFHWIGCWVDRCPSCGGQSITCDCGCDG